MQRRLGLRPLAYACVHLRLESDVRPDGGFANDVAQYRKRMAEIL